MARAIIVSEEVYNYVLFITEKVMGQGLAPQELPVMNEWWQNLQAAQTLPPPPAKEPQSLAKELPPYSVPISSDADSLKDIQ